MAMVLSATFIGVYAWWVASRARRLDEALSEARIVLAKEQQAVALGMLATAAAHRLGSPLNTITVIGHELSRELPKDDPIYEDIMLLRAEIERCRVILGELDDYRSAESSTFRHRCRCRPLSMKFWPAGWTTMTRNSSSRLMKVSRTCRWCPRAGADACARGHSSQCR